MLLDQTLSVAYSDLINDRFKLSILAGDNTANVEFILFGRQAQRLTRKSAETLVAENPADFIPDELTKLLEKMFTWIVSFTDSTTDSGTITLQVNTVVGEVGQEGSIIPAMPATSQTSSLMLSEGATASMHGTSHQGASQQSQALPMSPIAACSDASHASNASPVRPALPASDAPQTPQSVKSTANYKVHATQFVINYMLLLTEHAADRLCVCCPRTSLKILL